jgi:hypothetical protein
MNSIPKYSRLLFVWAALLAFGLRSLIPGGYMPDFSEHAHGVFSLTVCDGTNHQNHPDVCPFSIGALYSSDGIKAPVVIPPFFAITATAALLPLLFKQHTIFSNASPRSPPLFS